MADHMTDHMMEHALLFFASPPRGVTPLPFAAWLPFMAAWLPLAAVNFCPASS